MIGKVVSVGGNVNKLDEGAGVMYEDDEKCILCGDPVGNNNCENLCDDCAKGSDSAIGVEIISVIVAIILILVVVTLYMF